jgi:hypothetical protein
MLINSAMQSQGFAGTLTGALFSLRVDQSQFFWLEKSEASISRRNQKTALITR